MRRRILLLYAIAIPGLISAQTAVVRDLATHQPLEWVTLYGTSSAESSVTDIKGRADVSIFLPTDTILVRSLGYETKRLSLEQLKLDNYKVYLTASNIPLEEVVVSASRWEQERREVPGKITTIKASEIAFENPQTAADLIGNSGQVFIQKSQMGGGSPMIRGFAANRVLIVVDGVRMNNAIFRSGNLQNIISIDPFAVESAEVLFGPGSVMYGSDALGGVMDFHTLSPRLSTNGKSLVSGNAATRFASANFEKTGHLDFSIATPKWGFVTSATFSDFDDLRMGSNGPSEYLRPWYADRINGVDTVLLNDDPQVQIPTGYNQLNLMQKIRFSPDSFWNFNYGFHYSTTSDYSRYDRLVEWRNGAPRSAQWYYGPQQWMMHTLTVEQHKKVLFHDQARLIAAYQFFEESRHDRSFGTTSLRHRTEKVNAISFNLDLDKQLAEKHRLFYGAEVLLNTVGSTGEDEDIETGEVVPEASRYPDGATWNAYAFYANYRFNPIQKLTLQAAVRYNQVVMNAEFDTTYYPFPFTSASLNTGALNGSLGAAFRPTDDWQLSMNLSTGFRAPNVDDIGKVFDSEPGVVIVPNPDLKPEYAYSIDLGVAKTIGEWVKVDAAGFCTLLEDAMVRRDFQLNGLDSIVYDGTLSRVMAIQNAARAYVYGVQVGLEAKLPAGFGLSSHFSYQTGEEEDENTGVLVPLRHAPPWFGETHLTYTRNRLKADFYAVYNGELSYSQLAPSEQDKPHLYATDTNGDPYSAGWYTLNLKASYQLTDFLQLNAGLENITDQLYRPYSSGIAGPGCNAIVALRARF